MILGGKIELLKGGSSSASSRVETTLAGVNILSCYLVVRKKIQISIFKYMRSVSSTLKLNL